METQELQNLLTDSSDVCPFVADEKLFPANECASDTIEKLLREHRALRIGRLSHPLLLDRPIVLPSGSRLSIHEQTVLRMMDGCGGCMARNEHIFDGMDAPVCEAKRDSDILIEGGIWDMAPREPSINDADPVMRRFAEIKLILGVLSFSHAERIAVRRLTIRRGEEYGVLLADCRDFVVDGVFFDGHKKDGVHVNGPAAHGLLQNLRGNCGDDFVALNAWDWDSSAISFGAISDVCVRHIRCEHDEMRLLPGRKTYPGGGKTECPVSHCAFSDISGVYNFKLYQQPNCHNAEREKKDFSEIAGLISEVSFSDVRLDSIESEGFAEVHLDALFEIGADCKNLRFEHFAFGFPASALGSIRLVAVGPKSSTWTRGLSDPACWCELFEPDLICTAEDVTLSDIRFADGVCRDEARLIQAHALSVNRDYPATRPRGGTGYGVLRGVKID